jgi:CheY-like chemotaxis protein/anti-sigma regulatory factor (Ser/Thr protein kinase)
MGDPDRLQQIVWNLLSNAIKFTPEGGTVEVRTLRVGSQAQIQVRDTGIGIKQEFLPYVFDRFRQADSTTTRTHGGLGLGLAIVRHLVELHHGRIYADSEGEGKGSTFTVELSFYNTPESKQLCVEQAELTRESDPSASQPSVETLKALSGLQVLVVDDEPDVRKVLVSAIEQEGAKAIAATSVGEAMETLEQVQPNVLVSDIGMPDEDGYALIRKIRDREAEQGKRLPAIALTAYTEAEECKQTLEAGFQLYISKPVNTTRLVMAIAKLARRALTEEVVSAES